MFSGFAPPDAKDAKRRGAPPQPAAGSGDAGGFGAGLTGMMGRLGLGGGGASEPLLPAPVPRPPKTVAASSHSRTPPPQPQLAQKMTADERMGRYLEAVARLSETGAPRLAAVLRAAKPVLSVALQGIIFFIMGYVKLYSHLYDFYAALPVNQIQMLLGLILCFFGGTYVTLIAAVEAFRTMGGQGLYGHLSYVYEQVKVVSAADARDNLLDENRDGIADVDQISVDQLTQRKMKVCMKAVEDPARLQSAVGSLWSASLAVLATLKLQFAQTAAYAMAIADLVKFPLLRIVAPGIAWVLGPELMQWADPIIDSSIRIVCILLVWYMEKVRAAFYSGIRGGKMFAEALIAFLDDRGLMDKVPDCVAKKPFNVDESYLDEAIGFTIAAVGFYWQISHWFFLPHPLDWLLWPVSMAEYFLEVQVSWAK